MDAEELKLLVDRMVEIGCALSVERHLDVLLEVIVDEARRFTNCDGGTLFIVDPEQETLNWAIVQNESMNIRFGGATSEPLSEDVFKPIQLYTEAGAPRRDNVAAYVGTSAEPVNIADVYEHEEFDFRGPREFDASTGYRTKSMLVVPLLHFDSGVVGVLQLINARDRSGQIMPFAPMFEGLTASLASQAAVALKNAELFQELENQFEAFTRSIAMAIDEKSPYTAGHVRRVVDITMRIANAIASADDGPYAAVEFSRDELTAIRIAAWMHDVGKITTPEWVVDKATKLETLFDRIELVQTRWELMKRDAEIRSLRRQLAAAGVEPIVDDEARAEIAALDEEVEFLSKANKGVERMADEDVDRVETIATREVTVGGRPVPVLSPDEVKNLSVRRGTLTWDEIQIIRDHAMVSYKILTELPFSGHLRRVPEIAAAHHEKLNGKGYPHGLRAPELSLEARLLAIADIFEALTAADRPYKDPTPLSRALKILQAMVSDGDLDGQLLEFAIVSGVLDGYAEDEIAATQRDVVLRSAYETS